jgi:hypothetical protein
MLRCHVNAWAAEAYELNGFARSIARRPGGFSSGYFDYRKP